MKKAQYWQNKGYVDVPTFRKKVGVSQKALEEFLKEGLPFERALNARNQEKRMIHPTDGAQWIEANGKSIRGEASPEFEAPSQTTPPVNKPVHELPGNLAEDNIWGMAKRARVAEIEALRDLESGQKNNEPAHIIRMLRRNYVDTMDQARKVYSLKDEIEKGMQAAWDEQIRYSIKWAEPIKALVEAAPRSVAPRFNPSNPVQAEAAFRDWIEGELLPLMRRPVTKD